MGEEEGGGVGGSFAAGDDEDELALVVMLEASFICGVVRYCRKLTVIGGVFASDRLGGRRSHRLRLWRGHSRWAFVAFSLRPCGRRRCGL